MIQQVGAAGAFLGDAQLGVHKDRPVRAGFPAGAAADTGFGIDEYQPVLPPPDGPGGTGLHASGIFAVTAEPGNITRIPQLCNGDGWEIQSSKVESSMMGDTSLKK